MAPVCNPIPTGFANEMKRYFHRLPQLLKKIHLLFHRRQSVEVWSRATPSSERPVTSAASSFIALTWPSQKAKLARVLWR
jgi:hypothetical protein